MRPRTGIALYVIGFIAIDWQQLNKLLAGINPICACLIAAKEPAATPMHVNPNKQSTKRMAGIIAKPINAPFPPSYRASSTVSRNCDNQSTIYEVSTTCDSLSTIYEVSIYWTFCGMVSVTFVKWDADCLKNSIIGVDCILLFLS